MKELLREKYDSNLGIKLKMYQTEKGIEYGAIPSLQRPINPKSFELPIYAHVCITDMCNLKCPYCYASDGNRIQGNMDFERIESLINLFDKNGVFSVTWTGGEPFCHPDLHKIISLTHSKSMIQTVLTNGTMIPTGFFEESPKTGILYQFSLNEAWSENLKDKENHYTVYHNISECNRNHIDNILTILLEPFSESKIERLFKELVENGVRKVRMSYKMPVGKCSSESFDEYFKSLIKSIPLYKKVYEKYKDKIFVHFQCDCIPANNKIIPVRFEMCEAGTTLIYIDNNGDVFPCPLFKSVPKLKCGNVFDDNWRELWNSAPMEELRSVTSCENCESKCLGWCRAIKFFSTNVLSGPGKACRKLIQ